MNAEDLSTDDNLSEYRKFGKKFEKAIKVVEENGVKLHKFYPSKREIWMVIGKEGNHYVDITQPFCSCEHFYYKVIGRKDELCYHILSLKMAKKINRFKTIYFDDVKYAPFLENLLEDITRKK